VIFVQFLYKIDTVLLMMRYSTSHLHLRNAQTVASKLLVGERNLEFYLKNHFLDKKLIISAFCENERIGFHFFAFFSSKVLQGIKIRFTFASL